MKPYLDGVADWLKRDFEVDVAPLPAAIARAIVALERQRPPAPDGAGPTTAETGHPAVTTTGLPDRWD